MDPGEILRNLTEGWNWVSYAAGAATPTIGYLALSKYSNWQMNRELRREEAERVRKEEERRASARRESYSSDRSTYRDTFGQSTYRAPVTTPKEPYRAPVTPAREAPRPAVTPQREPYRPPVTPATSRPAVTQPREAPRPQLPATPRKPETPALPVDPIEAARKRQRELGDGDKPKQLGSGR